MVTLHQPRDGRLAHSSRCHLLDRDVSCMHKAWVAALAEEVGRLNSEMGANAPDDGPALHATSTLRLKFVAPTPRELAVALNVRPSCGPQTILR